MQTTTMNAEHTVQLRIPMIGIIFANAVYVRGFIESESSHHAPYGHFLCDRFGGVLERGAGGLSRHLPKVDLADALQARRDRK